MKSGKSPSKGIVNTSADRGQTIMSAYPMDNAGGVSLPNERGGKMGGSSTNIAHSLKGASVVDK